MICPKERLKVAIADAITIFSRIDHAVIECIWVLEEADLKRKKQIAKEHAHENIKFVRRVVDEHMKLDIGPTWDALDEMRHRPKSQGGCTLTHAHRHAYAVRVRLFS